MASTDKICNTTDRTVETNDTIDTTSFVQLTIKFHSDNVVPLLIPSSAVMIMAEVLRSRPHVVSGRVLYMQYPCCGAGITEAEVMLVKQFDDELYVTAVIFHTDKDAEKKVVGQAKIAFSEFEPKNKNKDMTPAK